MQFLNPIWFFAAAAVLIPLAIHLWNIKPGRVLKIGSISLISEASRKSSRSFKFTDIPLLILRCLFLILLAFLLAAPYLQQQLLQKKPAGWVLVPSTDVKIAYAKYKKPIDSLLKKGYEFHYFNDSLSKADSSVIGQQGQAKKGKPTSAATDYWGLIRQLDTKVAADVPVYLYTSNTAAHFTGDRPSADLNLHWQTYADADTTAQWVQNAWFNTDKTIRLVKGTSNTGGTSFTYTTLRTEKGDAQYKIDVQNGKALASLNGQTNGAVTVDTTVIKIAIYTDQFQNDAAYLKAAIDAAGQFSQRPFSIKFYNNSKAIPAQQTWIFWLSEQPVPANLLTQKTAIIAYKKGKQNLMGSMLVYNQPYALPNGDEQSAIFKTTGKSTSGEPTWQNGYGDALLTSTKQKQATVYDFYSRFSPGYNDLVWSSAFPRQMLQLIFGGHVKDFKAFEKRTVTLAQFAPTKLIGKSAIASKFLEIKELSLYFWLALTVLFFAERWLATSNKMAQTNG